MAASAGCGSRLSWVSGDTTNREQEPVTVETLDAPGSEPGTTTVPAPGRVTFVEFFATTCDVCASQMPAVGDAYERVDDVQFLSVTSEPVGLSISRSEVASWWDANGGNWPVGIDDGTELTRRYDATAIPTAVVVDAGGTVRWTHAGRIDADTIVDAIESAGE